MSINADKSIVVWSEGNRRIVLERFPTPTGNGVVYYETRGELVGVTLVSGRPVVAVTFETATRDAMGANAWTITAVARGPDARREHEALCEAIVDLALRAGMLNDEPKHGEAAT